MAFLVTRAVSAPGMMVSRAAMPRKAMRRESMEAPARFFNRMCVANGGRSLLRAAAKKKQPLLAAFPERESCCELERDLRGQLQHASYVRSVVVDVGCRCQAKSVHPGSVSNGLWHQA